MIYEYAKKYHYCVKCGKQDARTLIGKTRCFDCAEKARVYYEVHRERIIAQEAPRQKEIYNERLAAGICVACGKRKAAADHVRCPYCLKKDSENAKRRSMKNGKGLMSHSTAASIGFCALCMTVQALPGRKLCQTCYDKSVAALRKARANVARDNYFRNSIDARWKQRKQ